MANCSKCGIETGTTHRYCRFHHAEYMREWRKTHPLTGEALFRANCRSYANVYVSRGKLKRQPCEVCGKRKAEMHHARYDRPLEVRWLCRPHHLEHHVKHRYR